MIRLKTKKDISLLREGGKKHARIMQKLSEMVKPGVRTDDIDKAAREYIKEEGGEPSILNYKPYGAYRPFPASICVSVNDVVVHGIPNENPITLSLYN